MLTHAAYHFNYSVQRVIDHVPFATLVEKNVLSVMT